MRRTDGSAEEPRPHVLREYALLADGERGVIVGPQGEFAFMCFPSWADDAVFSSLIGGDGYFSVTPRARFVWGGYYEPGSLIWHSRWMTQVGLLECREALAMPGDRDRVVILRRLIGLDDGIGATITLRPAGNFGVEPMKSVAKGEDGTWRGKLGDFEISLHGAPGAEVRRHGGKPSLVLDLTLDAGERFDVVAVLSRRGAQLADVAPDELWSATEATWRDRVPSLDATAAPRDARHAYAVLTGLTSRTGGMVAAATTSLPERAEAGRNYDYRYVWIRDQCYCGQAVAAAGSLPLLHDAVSFISERLLADGPKMAPGYTIDGGRIPDERRLELAGYPGGQDIVGNHVNEQFQLDAFGESLLLLAAAGRHDALDAQGWLAIEAAASAVEQRWRDPDAGVWELDDAPWTHSRLICVAGLRAVAELAGAGARSAEWITLADTILAETAASSVHPSGRWQRGPHDERVDAALLTAALRGAVPPQDPRSVATLRAVEEELAVDGYAYRFKPDERPLGEAEGAFLLCGFWLALAHHQQGNDVHAVRWFERNRAACGPPGLLSEEFDVEQRQLRGNLPQAFAHALLLECAATLGPGV